MSPTSSQKGASIVVTMDLIGNVAARLGLVP